VDAVRYWCALLAVISVPPAIAYWFVVHPLVDVWRRLGKVTTFTVMFVMFVAMMYGLWTVRDVLLAIEYGADWRLWAPAVACYGLAAWIQMRIKKQLTFRVLAGAPELDADGKGGKLMSGGLYARMRHPRYVAVILGTIAWALFTNYLAMYVLVPVTVVGLLLVVTIEERELARRFGEEYARYRETVPMFIPRFGANASG
jgi:protein-S-isoprenylcysteine O-methyltransferase Ste14